MRPILGLLASALLALAQNTAKFPASVPTTADLGVASNRAETTLATGIDATATSLPVLSSAGFREGSFVTIDNEIMHICDIPDGTHLTLGVSACPNVDGRGVDTANGGGPAAAHLSGRTVQGRIVAWNVNQAAAETIAMAKRLDGAFVNVKEYGAKGDGVADDTAEIQSAIDAVNAAGGGRVYFPPGRYIVGVAGIRLYSDVEAYGAGDSTVIPVPAAQSFDTYGLFWGDTVSNVYLHDLWIKGDNTSSSPQNLNQKGTYFTTTTATEYRNIKIQRLHITGLAGEAIYSDGGATMVAPSGVDYLDNTIEHCSGPDALVHNFTGGGSGHVEGNYANDVIVGYEGPAENSDISFNRFWGVQYYGIWVHNFTSTDHVRVRVIGNTLRGVQTGPNAPTSVGIFVGGWGMQVIGNDVSGFGAPGIAVYPALRAGGNPQSAIRNIILGNTVHGNGNLATGLAPQFYQPTEIQIMTGADSTILEGNQVEFETSGTSYGIYNTGTNTTLSNNIVQGGFSADLIEAGTNTISAGNRLLDDYPSGQPFTMNGALLYDKRNDGTGATNFIIRPGASQGTTYLVTLTPDGAAVAGGIDQNYNWQGGVGTVTFKNGSNANIGKITTGGNWLWGGTTDRGPLFNIDVPDTSPGTTFSGTFAVWNASNKPVAIGGSSLGPYLQSFSGPLLLNSFAGSKEIVQVAPYMETPDADLSINTCSLYLDEGTPNLKVKCRLSSGAVKTATVSLL